MHTQKHNPLFAETLPSRNFSEVTANITTLTGIRINPDSQEKDNKGQRILYDDGILRLVESLDGNMVMTNSFGYDLKFDKNSALDMDRLVETVCCMSHLMRI